MNFKSAKIITENALKKIAQAYGQCDCDCDCPRSERLKINTETNNTYFSTLECNDC